MTTDHDKYQELSNLWKQTNMADSTHAQAIYQWSGVLSSECWILWVSGLRGECFWRRSRRFDSVALSSVYEQ